MTGCPSETHPAYIHMMHPRRGQSVIIENWPGWRQELVGTIAQRLNLEHEIHHSVSKLCILGFEPLNWSLIAEFGDMSIRTASWSPSMLASQLQAQHILYSV